LIEDACTVGESLGLSVWCCDQAGPFQTVPHPGRSWRPEGDPARQPHEHARNGTAQPLTLFHPADGRLRVRGATACPDSVPHPWLKRGLEAVLAGLPERPPGQGARAEWERWQEGLPVKPTLPAELPPLRPPPVLDNLTGHRTPGLVLWPLSHGVMPPCTPVSGSWLNTAEGTQRVPKRRALEGQHPADPSQIITWLEAAARHRNDGPTPFRWGGKRALGRKRQRERRHRVGGSGARTCRPVVRVGRRDYGHAQRE
jgi:hypothetical protein